MWQTDIQIGPTDICVGVIKLTISFFYYMYIKYDQHIERYCRQTDAHSYEQKNDWTYRFLAGIVSDQAMLKPDCSATETSAYHEILHVAI